MFKQAIVRFLPVVALPALGFAGGAMYVAAPAYHNAFCQVGPYV